MFLFSKADENYLVFVTPIPQHGFHSIKKLVFPFYYGSYVVGFSFNWLPSLSFSSCFISHCYCVV